jgi:hypothetical protein
VRAVVLCLVAGCGAAAPADGGAPDQAASDASIPSDGGADALTPDQASAPDLAWWSGASDCPVGGFAYTYAQAGACAVVGSACELINEWTWECQCAPERIWHCCGDSQNDDYPCPAQPFPGGLCCGRVPAGQAAPADVTCSYPGSSSATRIDCVCPANQATDAGRWRCGEVDGGIDGG